MKTISLSVILLSLVLLGCCKQAVTTKQMDKMVSDAFTIGVYCAVHAKEDKRSENVESMQDLDRLACQVCKERVKEFADIFPCEGLSEKSE